MTTLTSFLGTSNYHHLISCKLSLMSTFATSTFICRSFTVPYLSTSLQQVCTRWIHSFLQLCFSYVPSRAALYLILAFSPNRVSCGVRAGDTTRWQHH